MGERSAEMRTTSRADVNNGTGRGALGLAPSAYVSARALSQPPWAPFLLYPSPPPPFSIFLTRLLSRISHADAARSALEEALKSNGHVASAQDLAASLVGSGRAVGAFVNPRTVELLQRQVRIPSWRRARRRGSAGLCGALRPPVACPHPFPLPSSPPLGARTSPCPCWRGSSRRGASTRPAACVAPRTRTPRCVTACLTSSRSLRRCAPRSERCGREARLRGAHARAEDDLPPRAPLPRGFSRTAHSPVFPSPHPPPPLRLACSAPRSSRS